MNKGKLDGKVAIVTGAGSGLGEECARVLALHGARVAVVDIQAEAAAAVAQSIRDGGGDALAITTDMVDEDQIRAMAQQVVAHFGRIDVLHNNAAALDTAQRHADRDVCNVDIAAWDRAMDVNARGAMLACKHVVPHMLAAGGGSIIFATSGFGALGDVTLTSYAASKAALMALARSVAAQYGKQGIRSNAIMIGLALTEKSAAHMPAELKQILLDQHLTPTLGRPRQIADVVAFLASEESSFITGAVLPVDGGFTSHSPAMVPLREFFARAGSNKL
jgi:NAD(P)-dependent dehydrogenase (short-subunit alcohol dehydrogenase family)